MRAVSLVVPGQTPLDVAGQSDVIMRRGLQRLEHVDESLRPHGVRGRKFMASGNAPDFEPATLAHCNVRSLCVDPTLMDRGISEVRLRRYSAITFAWLA